MQNILNFFNKYLVRCAAEVKENVLTGNESYIIGILSDLK